jgi:arylsulfatase A-like enzyme
VHEFVAHCYPRSHDKRPLLGRAVRDARYRYVEWQTQAEGKVVARELYDLEQDPKETVNRIEAPEHAAEVERLAKALKTLGPAKPQFKE